MTQNIEITIINHDTGGTDSVPSIVCLCDMFADSVLRDTATPSIAVGHCRHSGGGEVLAIILGCHAGVLRASKFWFSMQLHIQVSPAKGISIVT